MKTFLTLDTEGIVAALLLGMLILIFGGQEGPFFLMVMILFLVLSYIATNFGKTNKKLLHIFERSRGWRNVVANGIIPVFAAFVYFLNAHYGFLPPVVLIISFVASVAAITADKFASEIGVLDGTPTMLLTFRKVRKGTSGAVTSIGLVVSLIAAFLIGLSLIVYGNFLLGLLIVTVSGFLGNIVDSVFGYFEEKNWGDKYTSNTLCSFAGWAISLLLLVLIL